MTRDALYEVAEAALNVYLDAARRAVGSPEMTEVKWVFLNELDTKLRAVFPFHPELRSPTLDIKDYS